MSLTKDDLEQIRILIRDEVDTAVTPQFRVVNEAIDDLAGEVKALGNDVREIYTMLKPLNSELNERLDDHEVRIGALETA